ncbi:MAG: ABC transporter substrate-binding protein [Gammaproteobacteria bacterium]
MSHTLLTKEVFEMLKRNLMILTFGLTLAFATLAPAETSAIDAVRTTVNAVLEILKNNSMDKDARRSAMTAEIGKRFDFAAMSQRTLATNWKKATDEEKREFTELFTQLIQNSYVGKIEAYTNEVVEYPAEKAKGKKALVETLIKTASADIPVNYKLYNKGGDWLVYDVIIEGVSLISNYRSSYQTIVKKEGFDGLMSKMKEKLKELETTS